MLGIIEIMNYNDVIQASEFTENSAVYSKVVQDNIKILKLRITGPLWGNSQTDCIALAKRSSNAGRSLMFMIS